MNMVTIIRHEVGKSMLLPFLPFAVIGAGGFGFVAVLFKMPDWVSVVAMVAGFLAVEIGPYWGGWSNEKLVRKYVKMVADEQEKVLPMAAAYKAELLEQLRLFEQDPLLVFERLRQREIEEVKNRHELSAGERSLDIKLSRRFRELTGDIELMQFAKQEGLTLSPQEIEWLRQHIRDGINYNDLVTADAQKTLTEARAYLAQPS